MPKNMRVISTVIFLSILFICSPPTNPTRDTRNAKANLVLESSDGKTSDVMIYDTAGFPVTIKVCKVLKDLFDSVKITVASNADTDTVCTLKEKTDTVKIVYRFKTPGVRTVTSTAFLFDGSNIRDNASITIVSHGSRITGESPPAFVMTGDSAVLFVKVFDATGVSFTWLKGLSVYKSAGDDTLVLRNITEADSGLYRCVISYGPFYSDTSGPVLVSVGTAVNHPPLLDIATPIGPLLNGRTYTTPAVSCTLILTVDDQDQGQTFKTAVITDIKGWALDTAKMRFIWKPAISDTGPNVVTFQISDNGKPPLSVIKNVTISVQQHLSVPSAPAGLKVVFHMLSGTKELVSLQWSYTNLTDSYSLFRAESGKVFTLYKAAVSDTQFTDTITAGSVYLYYLRAVNSNGVSGPSDTAGSSDIPVSSTPITITHQPTSRITQTEGGDVRIAVTVSGGVPPISYSWLKGGVAIGGKTDSVLAIASVASGDSGIYNCRIEDSESNTVTSKSCTLTVVKAPVAPSITLNPRDTTVLEGDAVEFSVTAAGTDLQYQWYKNGALLNDQNGNLITFTKVALQDSGAYYAKVCNNLDTVYSDTVYLTIVKSSFTISVTAGSHGKITPSGTNGIVTVSRNGNRTFTITADSSYRINEVLIDGKAVDSAGAQGVYTFTNVIADRSISVTFELIPVNYFTLSVTCDTTKGSVSIDPKSTQYAEGSTVTLTAWSSGLNIFKEWSGAVSGNQNPLTITMGANKTITAVFTADTSGREITLSPGASINAEIKRASASSASIVILKPSAGKYDQNTIEVQGLVTIPVQRR